MRGGSIIVEPRSFRIHHQHVSRKQSSLQRIPNKLLRGKLATRARDGGPEYSTWSRRWYLKLRRLERRCQKRTRRVRPVPLLMVMTGISFPSVRRVCQVHVSLKIQPRSDSLRRMRRHHLWHCANPLKTEENRETTASGFTLANLPLFLPPPVTPTFRLPSNHTTETRNRHQSLQAHPPPQNSLPEHHAQQRTGCGHSSRAQNCGKVTRLRGAFFLVPSAPLSVLRPHMMPQYCLDVLYCPTESLPQTAFAELQRRCAERSASNHRRMDPSEGQRWRLYNRPRVPLQYRPVERVGRRCRRGQGAGRTEYSDGIRSRLLSRGWRQSMTSLSHSQLLYLAYVRS